MKYRFIPRVSLVLGALVLLIGAGAAPALASGLKVTTNSAQEVGAYSATLTGSVYTPLGEAYRAGFKYGLTTEYGSESEAVEGKGQAGWNPVWIPIEGLEPETTYHFLFGAVAGEELKEGSDVTFTTSSPPRFEAAQYPATLSAEQIAAAPMSFNVEAGSVTCSEFGGTGTLSGTAKKVTLTPVFSGCSGLGGFLSVNVTTNGCTYVLHAGDPNTLTSTVDIACPEGQELEVAALTCAFSIAPQSDLPVILSNEEATTPDSIDVELALSNLDYTVTKDGFFCKFNGTGPREGGGLTGSERITATNGSGTAIYTKVGY